MICFAAATEAGFTRGIPGSNETYFNHACMIYGKQGKLHRMYIHYLCSSTPFRIKSRGAMPITIWLTAGVMPARTMASRRATCVGRESLPWSGLGRTWPSWKVWWVCWRPWITRWYCSSECIRRDWKLVQSMEQWEEVQQELLQ